ncbi:hypothetical protein [Chitiniphilus eburneus]|uniref:Uncharacterized protein n=1 Tax=Chitiniphilus eburneus TaxID=2571148 RepID=A0A4U0PIB6_9NEIS|nr:hypothetical protein [Chitiniphilus eburneus]TJZ67460.1 hypothetical protein FAZ21_16450 [Chitiniphilus eburneus]
MEDREFDELAGRIEGVAKMVLHLVVALEDAGHINGPQYADGLRRAIQPDDKSPSHLAIAQRTVIELADALDEARARRRGPAH